jgi:hypothetical protein
MSTEAEPIICRATPWYHKRRIAMLLLVFGFMIAFIYDWLVRYPREREAQAAFRQCNVEQGLDINSEKGTDAYTAMAKEKGWPEKPDQHKNYDYAIKWEQPAMAGLTGVAGFIMLFFYIRTVRGALTADAVSFSTADGQHVPFASAFRIDRRKWDHKGLAYVFYKNDKGEEKRAVIDDLIFGGAVKVLDRLQENFKGEIVDLEKSTDELPAVDGKPPAEEPGSEVEKTRDAAAEDGAPVAGSSDEQPARTVETP